MRDTADDVHMADAKGSVPGTLDGGDEGAKARPVGVETQNTTEREHRKLTFAEAASGPKPQPRQLSEEEAVRRLVQFGMEGLRNRHNHIFSVVFLLEEIPKLEQKPSPTGRKKQ